MNHILIVAGSDPSSGAGIELSMRYFELQKYYPFCVTTALTAQNSKGVQDFLYTPHPIFLNQLSSLSSDFRIDLIKIGLIAEVHLIYAFIDWYQALKVKPPVVFDPVLISTSDKKFYANDEVITGMREIIKLSTIITPNVKEASILSGKTEIPEMIDYFKNLGVKGIVITGGDNDKDIALDYVFDGNKTEKLSYPKIKVDNEIHGTGCLYSSAISYYYLETNNIMESATRAKAYVAYNIRNNIKKIGSNYYYFVF